ncbi:hypothetical protein LSH36_798g01023 [Paralvinella palmiformis]|uniref:Uncharacterized protein n=1 Tax=Paralvinella palmiformis TaxID=53620 RepID=A0AAD9J0R6_9ANNE|nr:hypothetical protein LSH36_798g01023 [Paralvinella palmiformis]
MDLLIGADIEHTGRTESVGRSHDAGGQHAPEVIPMSDLAIDRSEALRKIHAQSSAETSGLGDSLQRIHTLSSTETSGYGDTVPSPTAPSPSPEANAGRGICPSGQEFGHGVAGGGQPSAGTGTNPAYGKMTQRTDGRRTANSPANPGPEARSSKTNPGHSHPPRIPTGADGTPEFVSLAKGKTKVARTRKYARHASPPPPQIGAKLPPNRAPMTASTYASTPTAADDTADGRRGYGQRYGERVGDGRGSDLPRRTGARRPKLQRSRDLDESIDDDMVAYSPTETPPLVHVDPRRDRQPTEATLGAGAATGGSGARLGDGKNQSTWLKWSEDRRTSFKRRLDSLEQRQKDHERTRVSTPVRKARKESVMFVSPQLEDSHVSMADAAYPTPAVPVIAIGGGTGEAATGSGPDGAEAANVANHVAVTAARKPRRQEQEIKVDVRLSEYQMNALSAFWEHDVFVRSRWTGIALSLVSFMLGLIAATNYNWSTYTCK